MTGCATGPKSYEIKGEASPAMNRDASGKSLSVAVKLYQLKDAAEFSKLTFDMVASGRPDAELLGADLLSQSEIIMVPDTQYANTDKLKEETKFLGVVALFRQPDPHYWRFLVPAEKIRSSGLSFKIQDCYLVIATPTPSTIPGQPLNAQPTCTPEQRPSVVSSTRPATLRKQ